MSEENLVPDIPENILQRTKKPVAVIVSSIDARNKQQLSDSKYYAKITAENSKKVNVNDYLLSYDPLRGQLNAMRVVGYEDIDLDTPEQYRHIMDKENLSASDYIAHDRTAILNRPKLLQLESVSNFTTDLEPLGDTRNIIPSTAPLYRPNNEEMKRIFGLPEEEDVILNVGLLKTGNVLYQSEEGEFIPIGVTADTLRTHFSVIGQSGTGKTQFLKTVIKQLNDKDYALLVTDTQGDMAGMLWRNELAEGQVGFIKSQGDEPLWEHFGWDASKVGIPKEKVTIFYPPSISPDINPILYDARKNGVDLKALHINSSAVTSASELAIVLRGLTDAQFEALQIYFYDFTEKQKFDLGEFIDYMRDESNMPEGVQKISRQVLMRKLAILKNNKIFDTKTSSEVQYKHLMKAGHVSILFLPTNNIDTDVKALIELLLFKKITRKRLDKDAKYRGIVIDEAQDLIPKTGSSNVIVNALAASFKDLAEQGRKFWISLIVASQQPQNIHPTVFSQCSSRLFLRVSSLELDDIKAYIPAEYEKPLVTYKKLNALFVSPESLNLEVAEVKIPVPPVYHTDPKNISEKYPELMYIEDGEDEEDNVKTKLPTYNTETELDDKKDWEEKDN